MRIFVPLEDTGVDREAVLVPYRCGLACAHGLRAPPAVRDTGRAGDALNDESASRRPEPRRSASPRRR